MYTSIKINGLVIDKFLENYDVKIVEKYASSPNFTAISGKEVKRYLGDRRTLEIKFEPMETSQINQLFSSIKASRENIPIEYIDPQIGLVTKKFTCPNLPAATYFVSDDGRQFWTIPTINFEETDADFSDSVLGGGWDYILELGGVYYGNDEIPQDLSISVSGSSEGFSIGQCTSCSISGTVEYKNNSLKRNGLITLYRKHSDETLELLYQWFLVSYTTDRKTEINFSGNDIMAFTENLYLSDIPAELAPTSGIAKISIGGQVQVAQSVIQRLTGCEVTIDIPQSSNFLTEYNSGWSIRELLSNAAVWSASNYTAEIISYGKFRLTNKSISYSGIIEKDDFSPLKLGIAGNTINCVKIGRSENFDPVLRQGQTLEDYWIYKFISGEPTPSTTLTIVCPYVDDSVKENSTLKNLLGHSFGTEFRCENVRVDKILPANIEIGFPDYTDHFYIGNASYKLTTSGIYASISGGTKPLSDFEYIGATEKAIKSKIALNTDYGNVRITYDGGLIISNKGTVKIINSDRE